MQIIYVHGINQQAKSEMVIARMWSSALVAGAEEAGEATGRLETAIRTAKAPFYGDRLFALTDSQKNWSAVAMGADGEDDDFSRFAAEIVRDMARKAGASENELNFDDGATPLGAGIHKRSLKWAARALEQHAPFLAPHALKLLGQAYAYLKRPHIADEIDQLVRPAFETTEPIMVVAHSLGTIVSYKMLRERAEKNLSCSLFLTLGSPLGIEQVRTHFAKPRNSPRGVLRWMNASDPEDFVALRQRLEQPHFADGIENIINVENGYDDPHDVHRYLMDSRVRQAILDAI